MVESVQPPVESEYAPNLVLWPVNDGQPQPRPTFAAKLAVGGNVLVSHLH
jgi:hypothetical protein